MIPESLIIDCCRAMRSRELNHGTWPDGIPDCMETLCRKYFPGVRDQTLWLLAMEGVVGREAIRLVVERAD